jgi:hypothetical protein
MLLVDDETATNSPERREPSFAVARRKSGYRQKVGIRWVGDLKARKRRRTGLLRPSLDCDLRCPVVRAFR